MNSPVVPANAYTDAPELHRNLFLGSLQSLFWLFFHPLAWRNHIARIDPALSPDFALAGLSWAQWRNPDLLRLMMAHLIWPLLIGLVLGLALWGLGIRVERIWQIVGIEVTFMLIFGALVSIARSLAYGVAGSLAGGLVSGLAVLLLGGAQSGKLADTPSVDGLMGALAICGAVGVAGSMAVSLARWKSTRSSGRWTGGIVIGAAIGMVTGGLLLGLPFAVTTKTNVPYGREYALYFSSVVGVALFVAITLGVGWRTKKWRRGALIGMAVLVVSVMFGLVGALGFKITDNGFDPDVRFFVAFSALFGAVSSMVFVLPYLLAERAAGPWAGAVASTLPVIVLLVAMRYIASQNPDFTRDTEFENLAGMLGEPSTFILALATLLLGLTLTMWLPVLLYPFLAAWNLVLYQADEPRAGHRPSPLRWHSAFWYEHQRLPLYGLDQHLLLVMERNPAEGQAAAEFLTVGRQRWAAREAQIELDARRLERCADAEAISQARQRLAADELEGPASALLRSFSRVSQDVDAALRQGSAYNQRLALSVVEERLDSLLRELIRSSEPYVERFRPIVASWREIIAKQIRELAKTVEERQEIDSPYVIGLPLTEFQEIFVGRTDVSARIEQLLLDRRRPPLLLYGQRRMGKSSLLINLGRLLPSAIIPLFVDLQGIVTAGNHAGLLYGIARSMAASAEKHRDLIFPALARESLANDPFTIFNDWLDEVEKALGENTALLALDEFEVLFDALSKGRYSEPDVLGMLRHLIQHRPKFKVLLAGSHTLSEFQRWSSYLINVQVIKLGYLKEEETLQLIEHPIPGFALRYEPEASRRVVELTNGHPMLVQQLCEEIVALKNEQDPAIRRLARLPDVEAAVEEAISHGSFFFADIEVNQVDPISVELLRFIAARGEGAIVDQPELDRQFAEDLELALDLPLRRDLIEPVNGGYRFQVEMIRRWFAQEGRVHRPVQPAESYLQPAIP